MSCATDIYFWRQITVLITNCLHSIGTGFMLSFPSVLNPSIISANNSDITVTSDQASWIAASHGFAGIIGFFTIPPLMQVFGRRFAITSINFLGGMGFLIFILAKSSTTLYIARIIQGMSICGVYISPIVLGEYSHPKRRGYFITIKNASIAIGSLLCHGTSLCWTWRQISGFAMIPYICSILITFIWPESPAFLAMKGKYEESSRAHAWLYGENIKNKNDIEDLITAQKQRRNRNGNQRVWKALLKRDFWKPFIIVSLITMIIDACGRYYMLAYTVQILTEITKDKFIAVYCTVGSDLLTLVALSISFFIIRRFNRRTILFTSGTIAICLMLLISLLSYLESKKNIASIKWGIPCILLLNVFIVNAGVIPTCFAIIGEIFPLEHKGIGACSTGIVFTILYALVMKFTPIMMEKTGVEGTFGIYSLCVTIGLLIQYFILNETKDKTLQEIENQMKGIATCGLNESLCKSI